MKTKIVEHIAGNAMHAGPSDEQIEAWADSFILKRAFNRPVAIQIATEAAKWARSLVQSAPAGEAAPAQPADAYRIALERIAKAPNYWTPVDFREEARIGLHFAAAPAPPPEAQPGDAA